MLWSSPSFSSRSSSSGRITCFLSLPCFGEPASDMIYIYRIFSTLKKGDGGTQTFATMSWIQDTRDIPHFRRTHGSSCLMISKSANPPDMCPVFRCYGKERDSRNICRKHHPFGDRGAKSERHRHGLYWNGVSKDEKSIRVMTRRDRPEVFIQCL